MCLFKVYSISLKLDSLKTTFSSTQLQNSIERTLSPPNKKTQESPESTHLKRCTENQWQLTNDACKKFVKINTQFQLQSQSASKADLNSQKEIKTLFVQKTTHLCHESANQMVLCFLVKY